MPKKVLVIYHSQQAGNTEACARLVAQGLREAGDIEVELINTNQVNRVDMAVVAACDGLAIGSPDYASYMAGTIKQLFDDIYVARMKGQPIEEKPCVLFMTHGGGGRGIEPFRAMAKRLHMVAEPFVCKGAPEQGCPEAIELGRKLAAAVKG